MRNPILLIASCGMLLTACSSAPYTSASGSASTAAPRIVATTTAGPVRLTLTVEQAAAVRAWYGETSQGQSQGRGRNGGLPPGIARNLDRGKPLPPGIAKQYLPQDLVVHLPRLDNGLDYVVAAGKLLLVETATQVVRQVLLESVFG